MSKIALTPSATGTGVFTISSPATNTDRTLTLPDEAGTVLTSASSLASANLTGTVTVSGGNVGIGTSTPNRQIEASTFIGGAPVGSGFVGGALRLSNTTEYESNYGTGGGNPDFLGSLEFYSGDTSTGAGVRTAIKTTVDTYVNTNSLCFYTAPSASASGIIERLRIDPSGNVGIGVVPSAWRNVYPDKALDLGTHSALYDQFGSSTYLANNFYRSDDNSFKYKTTAGATAISLDAGDLSFFNAPSGTAGTTATLTNRMTLNSSGGLILAGSTAQKATGTTWSNPSDQRLKTDIRDYTKGSAELMQVRVREWLYNGKGGTVDGMAGLGVIADEVMTVLPDTVETYEAFLEKTDELPTAIKKFDATEITWLLVTSLQEALTEISALKVRVAALEAV